MLFFHVEGVLNGDKGDKGTTGTPSSSSTSERSKGESKPTSSLPEKPKSDDRLLQEHITPPSSIAESTVSTSPLNNPMTATATHVGGSTMSHSPDNVYWWRLVVVLVFEVVYTQHCGTLDDYWCKNFHICC